MPRDGANIYHRPPGTDAVPDTTIESSKYNAYVADVEQDLNLPRPIVAGGTGANNALQAMQNLGGEIAKQVVTNYDSFPWVNGSFYSAAGATSAPNPTNRFAGIYYANADDSYATVEARDQTTGILYIRNKVTGVWGAWAQGPGSLTDTDARYVNVTGDTMTGNLTISSAGPFLVLNKTAAGQQAILLGETAGNPRWAVIAGDGATESGANAGSDFAIGSYTDAGANLGSPLYIKRSTGVVTMQSGASIPGGGLSVTGGAGVTITTGAGLTPLSVTGAGGKLFVDYTGSGTSYYDATAHQFRDNAATIKFGISTTAVNVYQTTVSSSPGTGALTVAGGVGVAGNINAGGDIKGGSHTSASSATTGAIYFGNSGAKYLSYESNLFNFVGGPLSVPDATVPTDYSGGALRVQGGIGVGAASFFGGKVGINGGGYALSGTVCSLNVAYAGAGTAYGMALRPNADSTVAILFANAANGTSGSINQTSTTVAYNTSSDERLKEDLKSFDAGNIIDDTNVYDFAWKSTGERNYGVIAQQAVNIYPAAVTYTKELDFWGVDYSKYVPVLLQELKALRARVAELEGRIAVKPA